MKSTSIHRLNADKGLSKWGRRLWYALNWLNNSVFPNWKDHRLEIRKFAPRDSADVWAQVALKSSPSRALSDLFWMQLPWERIQDSLGRIHILDTGCGSGRYGLRLQQFSGGRVATYTGLDERFDPDWPSLTKESNFIKLEQADSAHFAGQIPAGTNLFISQSAIEHFPEDLTYFRQLRDFVAATSRPTLQFHLFPSAACLRLYRYHGVRQYTPRTISLIARLFPKSKCTLFALGGAACNSLHWKYITKPAMDGTQDQRETLVEKYRMDLMSAINVDIISSGSLRAYFNDSSFWALVIQTDIKGNALW